MDKVALRKVIFSVDKELKEALDKADTCRETIRGLRNMCKHDMKLTGHDSHKDHYVCTICGETE